MLAPSGYTRLSDNPEIQAAVNYIAEQISVMTIYLMQNTKTGDMRIQNELSRKIDINPSKYLNRQQWIEKIVRDILLTGNSVHIPHYNGKILDDIQPLSSDAVRIVDQEYGYTVQYHGITYDPDEVLHFSYNQDPNHPWNGRGLSVILKDVAKWLAQARNTATKLMESPAPSIIVKVDGLTEEFASKEGREKLGKQYLDSSETGSPWFIPAEAFEIEKVAPLNLNDLAIADNIKLDKHTAAAVIGVPPYIVGDGQFDKDEHNNWVGRKLLPIVTGIQQELTRKILISPDWYFKLNPRSLYAYTITELAEVDCNLVDRAIIDRNEARDDMGRTPREGLSELAILENYIPYSKIGNQNKLKGGEDDGKTK